MVSVFIRFIVTKVDRNQCSQGATKIAGLDGLTENDGHEIDGPSVQA